HRPSLVLVRRAGSWMRRVAGACSRWPVQPPPPQPQRGAAQWQAGGLHSAATRESHTHTHVHTHIHTALRTTLPVRLCVFVVLLPPPCVFVPCWFLVLCRLSFLPVWALIG